MLLRLVASGRDAIAQRETDAVEQRWAALKNTRGALTGAYGPDYLRRLRDDWPE